MRFKIIDVTEWEEDSHQEAGDSCHMPEIDIMRRKLYEYEQKIDQGKWPGLPFECEAENEDEAMMKYNDEVLGGDYYLATNVEFEGRHDFRPILLRQLIGTLDNDTLVKISYGDAVGQRSIDVFLEDYSSDDDGVCELVDPLLDMNVLSSHVGVSSDPTGRAEDKVPTVWITLDDEQ